MGRNWQMSKLGDNVTEKEYMLCAILSLCYFSPGRVKLVYVEP